MKKVSFYFALVFAAALVTAEAMAQTQEGQGVITPCGANEAMEKEIEAYPEILQRIRELEQFTRAYEEMGGDKALDSIYTIPVVFHVFHTYGPERISENQIRDCIRIINEDFQNLPPDSNQISSNFRPIAGRPQIRFRLAKRDPSGRCTKGINYITSALHPQGDESLKSVISWDTRKYLNIWVCSNILSGAAAYAFYPGTAGNQSREGIVSRHDYVGSIGTSSAGYAARTLTHEIGHYLNLPHTWGNSNTPGAASNCNIDDGVQDTPNCVGVTGSGCNLNQVSCGSLDNVENHMEYSSCRRMFTKGQVTRMHAAINSSTGGRNNLWKGANLIATGTTNDGPGDECPAKVDFKSNLTRVCTGQQVNFTQLAYNVNNPSALQFAWSFPGGTPETSTLPNPVVTYGQLGTYPVKLVVTNGAGKDSLVQANFVDVIPSETAYNDTETESFETTTFPNFPSQPVRNWEVQSSENVSWRRSTLAAFTGNASLSVSNNSSLNGSSHTLFSPVFEIVNGQLSGARVTFRYAFARRTTTNTDKLVVSYSTNCGRTWSQALNRTGSTLQTVASPVAGTFVPADADWKLATLNLFFLNGSPTFRLRFEFTSGGGNNIYIDDVQLLTVTSSGPLQQDVPPDMEVIPNPSSGLPELRFESARSSAGELEITDVMGRKILMRRPLQLQPGESRLDLAREMDRPCSGTYLVRLIFANRVLVRKWVVLP